MGYNTFYMNNFIGKFNTALGCKIVPGHLAKVLITLGYNIKTIVSPSPYPILPPAKPAATTKLRNTSANQQNTNVQQIRRPVIPIPAEDETNMDYMSYKLLKDDEVFYDHENESIDDLIERYGKMSILKYIRSLD